MKYRIFKERRLIKPYKIQMMDNSWYDCGELHTYKGTRQVCFAVRYYWTRRGAFKALMQIEDLQDFYE